MFVRNVRSSCAVGDVARVVCLGCCSAALLTRMSSRPNSFDRLLAPRRWQNSSSPMSPAIASSARPSCFDQRFASRRASSCSFEIDDRDVGAFAGERDRHGAADAAVAAGDQRHLAFSLPVPRVVRRVIRPRVHWRFAARLVLLLLWGLEAITHG